MPVRIRQSTNGAMSRALGSHCTGAILLSDGSWTEGWRFFELDDRLAPDVANVIKDFSANDEDCDWMLMLGTGRAPSEMGYARG